MLFYPWAPSEPTSKLGGSALPDAPVVDDRPSRLVTLIRRLARRG